jgi:hypothetical protein
MSTSMSKITINRRTINKRTINKHRLIAAMRPHTHL